MRIIRIFSPIKRLIKQFIRKTNPQTEIYDKFKSLSICIHCGALFMPKIFTMSTIRYCSLKCKQAYKPKPFDLRNKIKDQTNKPKVMITHEEYEKALQLIQDYKQQQIEQTDEFKLLTKLAKENPQESYIMF